MRAFLTLLVCLSATSVHGQVIQWSREDMVKFTPQWQGERFPDGRPKAPDALIEKLKAVSVQSIASQRAYQGQFVDSLRNLNPGKKLIGRAVTLQLMPTRQDVAGAISTDWRQKGNTGALNHQTAIDRLEKGDVLVIDAYGSLQMGGIIGDNLAYYIWKKTGTGFVIDGTIRDLEGISENGMPGFFRWATPPAIQGTMVMGINTPVRIGYTTVMPGDIVMGDRDGVIFIPPHQAESLAK